MHFRHKSCIPTQSGRRNKIIPVWLYQHQSNTIKKETKKKNTTTTKRESNKLKKQLSHSKNTSNTTSVPLPLNNIAMTNNGVNGIVYPKTQTFYSINPDEDPSLTNYFIFPDFDNLDPLCAIFVR